MRAGIVAGEQDPSLRMGLAAGWYVALRATELGRKPRALELFGRHLVAWRGSEGRAVVMPRYCPHLSADLALGTVVDGALRCPFHHWRFATEGTCVEIPGVKRIPPAASRRPYPVVERYGLIWVWYGGAVADYSLADVPALEADREKYWIYPFRNATPAPPRRILENAFDNYHFMTLHGVRSNEPLELRMLRRPTEAAENGPPIAVDAWLGALLQSHDLLLPKALTAMGINGKQFSLLVDGWPGGQRLTFYLDGEVVAKELLGITPIAAGRTIFQGWSLVRRTGSKLRDVGAYLMYRGQHWLGTREDLKIYRNAEVTGEGIPVLYDQSVLKFRRHYQEWVARAERAERTESLSS
ncbi:Rieske 2Fe-2S domain-containing protein [Saccharopolyspora phatthalungensis]|uniref:Nitrite reductase/ring-hydroxylating ferredoxin subunit n=1 Tax=Saccharopolyspora phatthalungensis TaxID=664693 RepID=A0A840QAN3_9PSEU|nr:Rieske 2Fe-2S domain-containing protein [Saccharopolyspora phatthalungensis]MBB5155619.1 nitrite reductase/ring-hydroxylating ferredoxin subunit [Saccharopolyspora phatthalungensis]